MGLREPTRLMAKLAARLFESAAEQEAFLHALTHPGERLQGVIWNSSACLQGEREGVALPPCWLPTWAEVRSTKERLGQTPEHERGDIYLLDASSLFTASCLLAIPEAKSALDLCASPGGKAIYGYRHLRPERFVCNDVIGKRHAALISNLRRCNIPAEVTQRDAKDIDEIFDAVWVDAPCSGQSLLAMGKDAHGAFHPNIINMNANRQKRILANAAQWVNAGGWLAYMTCTFSPDENEGVIQWFLARNPEWQIVPVPHLATHAKEVGYQLYPHQGHGAGGYCCLLRAPF